MDDPFNNISKNCSRNSSVCKNRNSVGSIFIAQGGDLSKTLKINNHSHTIFFLSFNKRMIQQEQKQSTDLDMQTFPFIYTNSFCLWSRQRFVTETLLCETLFKR